jgi:hypothetical protein
VPRASLAFRTLCLLTALCGLATACSSSGHRNAQTSTTTPSTSAPSQTSTTEPAPTYAPSPFVWQQAASPTLNIGGGATANLSGLLPPELSAPWTLVGTRLSASGTPSATVWTSPDGDAWSATSLDQGAPAQAEAVARYRGATVVVGAVGEGANEQAAVWTSAAPGTPFTRKPVPNSDGPSVMTLVTQGALGLFATGTVDGRFAVWSSTTGRRWGEVPSAERSIGSVAGARINTLMSEGDVVYAAGSVQSASGSQAALWASSDGIQWRMIGTAASSFSGPGSRVIYSLAPLGTGLVAVGAINRGNGWLPASWISPDGSSWSQPSTQFPGLLALPPIESGSGGAGSGSAALCVSAINTFSGATAVVASAGGPGGERAWKSTDGLHWSPLTLPAAAASSTAWRPTLIAGTTATTVIADGDPGQPHVLTGGPGGWAEPSSDPNVFGPIQVQATPLKIETEATGLVLQVQVTTSPQTIGSATTASQVLTSVDGATWQAAAPPTMPAVTLPAPDAVTARLPTASWVAVGQLAGAYPVSWTSPNGTTWTYTGPLDPVSSTTGSRPAAQVSGLCIAPPTSGTSSATGSSTANAVAAVGANITSGPPSGNATVTNRSAAAWWSLTGDSWHRATVTPSSGPASEETMIGCLDTGTGLVAYGTAAGPGGAPAPGLWRSTTGAAWSRQSVSAFSADSPNPITDLATYGSDWLAVADPAPLASQGGAASSPCTCGAGGTTPDVENGLDGIWLSTDSGQTWQRANLVSAPWPGALQTEVTLSAFADGKPVVVGVSDGRLAVWYGTPISPSASAG